VNFRLPPLWSSVRSSWLQIQRSGFDSWRYQFFWEVVGLERGPLSHKSTIEDLLTRKRKSSGSGLENRGYGSRDQSRWPRDTPLFAKVGTDFADKRRSLCRYGSLANWRLWCFFAYYTYSWGQQNSYRKDVCSDKQMAELEEIRYTKRISSESYFKFLLPGYNQIRYNWTQLVPACVRYIPTHSHIFKIVATSINRCRQSNSLQTERFKLNTRKLYDYWATKHKTIGPEIINNVDLFHLKCLCLMFLLINLVSEPLVYFLKNPVYRSDNSLRCSKPSPAKIPEQIFSNRKYV
jgi:hypothetical protein